MTLMWEKYGLSPIALDTSSPIDVLWRALGPGSGIIPTLSMDTPRSDYWSLFLLQEILRSVVDERKLSAHSQKIYARMSWEGKSTAHNTFSFTAKGLYYSWWIGLRFSHQMVLLPAEDGEILKNIPRAGSYLNHEFHRPLFISQTISAPPPPQLIIPYWQ